MRVGLARCPRRPGLRQRARARWLHPGYGKTSDLITTGTAPEFGSIAPISI